MSRRSERYLGLPLHAGQGDAQQHRHGDDPDDADVIGGVHDEGVVLLGRGNHPQRGNNPYPKPPGRPRVLAAGG